MVMPVVELREVERTYFGEAGKKSFGLFRKGNQLPIVALHETSFSVEAGSIVGILGPNGAGKTTLIRLMSGALAPSRGSVRTCGSIPSKRKNEYLRKIALISGQRRQLTWELSAMDSFSLYKAIYGISEMRYREQLDRLVHIFDAEDIVSRPIKKLSLGQRMRVEFIGSLLHRPEVVFLDEPTLGLDYVSRRSVWKFIKKYCRETGATIFISSHYMADIEAMAERVLLLDHGRIIFDNSLEILQKQAQQNSVITFEANLGVVGVPEGLTNRLLKLDENEFSITVSKSDVSQTISQIASVTTLDKINIADQNIEEVISGLSVVHRMNS